nr:4-hydroxythreonine-4-phosphate dehydrogenase PdxA [Roseovarius sp. MMSF_3281]
MRTSPDHGTAFDIASRISADPAVYPLPSTTRADLPPHAAKPRRSPDGAAFHLHAHTQRQNRHLCHDASANGSLSWRPAHRLKGCWAAA